MKRRRFRLRRKRLAALLPLTAALAIPAAGADAQTKAEIDASKHSVPVGDHLVLDGSFPGAPQAPIEINYRAQGDGSWKRVAGEVTGASGGYAVRVKPHGTGDWRATLAEAPPAAAVAPGVDSNTPTERVEVRSKTRARVAGRHELVGDKVKIVGAVAPAGERRRVVVKVGRDRVRTHTGHSGRFSVRWKAPKTGIFDVRAQARSNGTATGSRDSAGRVSIYRGAAASWYGPGLYGNGMACGGTLTPSTMGVANRSLPCGTKVHLRYGHRTVTVPVVDRGPYVGGREYDLTAATRQALGFPDVGTVLTTR